MLAAIRMAWSLTLDAELDTIWLSSTTACWQWGSIPARSFWPQPLSESK